MSPGPRDPGQPRPPRAASLLRGISAAAVIAALLLFAVSLIAAVPGLFALRRAPAAVVDSRAHVPQPSPSSAPGPTPSPDADAALWTRQCMPCHGREGTPSPMGKKLGAKDLSSEEVQKRSDDDIRRVITEGNGKMPSFRQLTDEQVETLVRRIRSFKK